jgi:glyceraldehyde 3-phosphate dehydrogenase
MRPSASRLAVFGANSRKFFVGGNWKANGTATQVKQWVSVLNSGLVPSSTEVVVAPPSIYLMDVAKTLRKDFYVAGQDAFASTGAHTGELSASMLKDSGLAYAIIGHSERRQKGESNEVVATKAKVAIEQGLTVIACLGETNAEREAGKTTDVVVGQLAAYAKNVSDWSKVVVAYEPVWAIGTGKTASPAQAQEVHARLRSWLHSNVSPAVAAATRIIYGGSVTGSTAKELAGQTDIDGFLVGGASLKPEFIDIVGANGARLDAGPIKVGINGFGRIGRLVLRAAKSNPLIHVTSIKCVQTASPLASYSLHTHPHAHSPSMQRPLHPV